MKQSGSFITQDLRDSNRKLGNLIMKFQSKPDGENKNILEARSESFQQIKRESQLEAKQTNVFGFQKSNSFTSNLQGLKNKGANKALTIKKSPTKFRFVSGDAEPLNKYLYIPSGSIKDENILPLIDLVSGEGQASQWKNVEIGKSRGFNTVIKEKRMKSKRGNRKKLDRYKSEVFQG